MSIIKEFKMEVFLPTKPLLIGGESAFQETQQAASQIPVTMMESHDAALASRMLQAHFWGNFTAPLCRELGKEEMRGKSEQGVTGINHFRRAGYLLA